MKNTTNKLWKSLTIAATATLVSASSLFLTGCIPTYYSEDFKAKVTDRGSVLIEDYMNKHYKDYEISSVSMEYGFNASHNMATYGSTFAKADVKIDGKPYTFYVDTDNGEMYSTMQDTEIRQAYADALTGTNATDYVMTLDALSWATYLDSYSDNTGAKLNEGVYDVEVTLWAAFPIDESAEDILQKYCDENGDKSITLQYFYCDDSYESFDIEELKDFMEAHPEVASITIYNISHGDLDYLLEGNTISYSYCLALKEEYSMYYVEDSSTQQNYLCGDYKAHTHEIVDGVVGVNYVSYFAKYGGGDFTLIREETYDVPVEVDGDYIITHKPEDDAPAFLFFSKDPGHSEANITPEGSIESKDYNIKQFRCGYYSILPKNAYVSINRGYMITADEKIVLVN